MDNALTIFNEDDFGEIRTALIDSEPYFMLADVCRVMEIGNPSEAKRRLKEAGLREIEVSYPSGSKMATFISESNLYLLVMRSNKPNAEKFIAWITEEVIPSIRKHGAYMTQGTIERALAEPDFLIQLATTLKEERQKRMEAEHTIKLNAPKVNFADSVEISKDSVLMRCLATILKQNGINIGQNRLFDWMRDNEYLIKRLGRDFNMPTQKAMDLGLFEIKERTINSPDGDPRIKRTPYVTGKGQIYFINKFLDNQAKGE